MHPLQAEAEEAVPEAFCEIPAPSQPTQRAATAGPSAVQPSPPATASQLRRKAVAGSAGQTGQAVAAAGDGEDGAGLEDEDLDGGAMAPAARRGFGSGGRRRALAGARERGGCLLCDISSQKQLMKCNNWGA